MTYTFCRTSIEPNEIFFVFVNRAVVAKCEMVTYLKMHEARSKSDVLPRLRHGGGL